MKIFSKKNQKKINYRIKTKKNRNKKKNLLKGGFFSFNDFIFDPLYSFFSAYKPDNSIDKKINDEDLNHIDEFIKDKFLERNKFFNKDPQNLLYTHNYDDETIRHIGITSEMLGDNNNCKNIVKKTYNNLDKLYKNYHKFNEIELVYPDVHGSITEFIYFQVPENCVLCFFTPLGNLGLSSIDTNRLFENYLKKINKNEMEYILYNLANLKTKSLMPEISLHILSSECFTDSIWYYPGQKYLETNIASDHINHLYTKASFEDNADTCNFFQYDYINNPLNNTLSNFVENHNHKDRISIIFLKICRPYYNIINTTTNKEITLSLKHELLIQYINLSVTKKYIEKNGIKKTVKKKDIKISCSYSSEKKFDIYKTETSNSKRVATHLNLNHDYYFNKAADFMIKFYKDIIDFNEINIDDLSIFLTLSISKQIFILEKILTDCETGLIDKFIVQDFLNILINFIFKIDKNFKNYDIRFYEFIYKYPFDIFRSIHNLEYHDYIYIYKEQINRLFDIFKKINPKHKRVLLLERFINNEMHGLYTIPNDYSIDNILKVQIKITSLVIHENISFSSLKNIIDELSSFENLKQVLVNFSNNYIFSGNEEYNNLLFGSNQNNTSFLNLSKYGEDNKKIIIYTGIKFSPEKKFFITLNKNNLDTLYLSNLENILLNIKIEDYGNFNINIENCSINNINISFLDNCDGSKLDIVCKRGYVHDFKIEPNDKPKCELTLTIQNCYINLLHHNHNSKLNFNLHLMSLNDNFEIYELFLTNNIKYKEIFIDDGYMDVLMIRPEIQIICQKLIIGNYSNDYDFNNIQYKELEFYDYVPKNFKFNYHTLRKIIIRDLGITKGDFIKQYLKHAKKIYKKRIQIIK